MFPCVSEVFNRFTKALCDETIRSELQAMRVLGLFAVLLVACAAQTLVKKPSSSSNTPSQYRVAFLPGGACISWYTPNEPTSTPGVVYGLSSSNLTMTASGVYHTVQFCLPCQINSLLSMALGGSPMLLSLIWRPTQRTSIAV